MLGTPLTLIAEFREYWGGIFDAHPWLSGPSDSYLGFWRRGGGASGEHSHAINIWQFFAHAIRAGRITEVNALLDYADQDATSYDRLCQLHVRTEGGLAGIIVQDVITEPSRKWARLQGDKGFLEWHVNYQKDEDRIVYGRVGAAPEHMVFAKTRPDDFKGEIDHVERLLDGVDRAMDSPMHLHRGLETMLVIAAAHRSAAAAKICLYRLYQRLDGEGANAIICNFGFGMASSGFHSGATIMAGYRYSSFVLCWGNRLCLF